MKKFLFILALGALAFTAKAQIVTFSHAAGNPSGSIVNTGTDTATAALNGYSATTGIQIVATRVTGTLAGTARMYGSIDGINYVPTGDSLVLSNAATNTVIFKKDLPVYVKWRVITVGSGTQVSTIGVFGIQRKPQ